ncbi:hypothetical protein BHE74_00022306 [Ensete ventricosum]|nr:hypothetical protein GW17_00018543 [Ensete ventricosum]RWW17523.1 hypothetical protein GW17_00018550 [Ensete ventricosum]RWW70060.1 hypothetical protein BHE74_00022306 [Ensete ventricosum]RZS16850.1 hypothetical protein BHM03_00048907 [Ensete ventricosum]
MLRVAGRRLAASLSWRPSCASSTLLSRNPIPGAASSDDDSRSHVVPSAGFHFESALLRSIRGLVFLLSVRSFFIFASKDSIPVANQSMAISSFLLLEERGTCDRRIYLCILEKGKRLFGS